MADEDLLLPTGVSAIVPVVISVALAWLAASVLEIESCTSDVMDVVFKSVEFVSLPTVVDVVLNGATVVGNTPKLCDFFSLALSNNFCCSCFCCSLYSSEFAVVPGPRDT